MVATQLREHRSGWVCHVMMWAIKRMSWLRSARYSERDKASINS